MLHHDYAPFHTAIYVKEVSTKKSILVVPQPQYAPDLSQMWLLPFSKHKFHLKGRQFGTVDNIQKLWQNCWEHCYMTISSTATVSGKNVSGGVWFTKGTTWHVQIKMKTYK
jgi:hypothetical protein